MINRSPDGKHPLIHNSSYIHPTAVIIGNVKIGKHVFVGPGAVIRADESKSSIFIEANCNVQDNVIIHSLSGCKVQIGKNTSLAHGCIVHGPCKIGKMCFIGFGSVVFDAVIEDKAVLKHLVVVENAHIPSKCTVDNRNKIDSSTNLSALKPSSGKTERFVTTVLKTNKSLLKGYKKSEKNK
ncbi:MAG: carbonate dehydratase [Elusimicrobia bacterium]|nr:carbonate dehydratase [Elusimicrobiota bacterium]